MRRDKTALLDLKDVTGVIDSTLVEAGRKIIRGFKSGQLYGLVWDSYLTTDGVKQDAVFVEAGAQGATEALVFAQVYSGGARSKKLEKVGPPLNCIERTPSMDLIQLDKATIEQALPLVSEGLEKYCRIQAALSSTDVARDRAFQTSFNVNFYQVATKRDWQSAFYTLLEQEKRRSTSHSEAYASIPLRRHWES